MTNRALLACWVYCQRKYDYCLQLYATFLRHRRFDEAVKTIDIQLIEDVAQSFNGNDNDNGKYHYTMTCMESIHVIVYNHLTVIVGDQTSKANDSWVRFRPPYCHTSTIVRS